MYMPNASQEAKRQLYSTDWRRGLASGVTQILGLASGITQILALGNAKIYQHVSQRQDPTPMVLRRSGI